MERIDVEEFVAAYVECALWSTNDESDESGGEPLDQNYTGGDLAPEALAAMRRDCLGFLGKSDTVLLAATRPRAAAHYSVSAQAGHDFWLTRNGHGAGFWDGDWSEPHATQLTAAAKSFGESHVYVGDDKKLYLMEG